MVCKTAVGAVSLRSPEDEKGFTLIELLIVVAIIGLLAAIAVPSLLRARMTANETSASASLRSVASAEMTYASVCGKGGYAVTFAALALGAPGSMEGFLSPDLAVSVVPIKSGYRFAIGSGLNGVASLTDCNGTPTTTTYYVSAVPVTVGATGTRGFAGNQSMSVWQDTSGAAPTEPFAVAAGVAPIH